MEYELRDWFEGSSCLYTNDRRVKDLALQSADLMVVASYFKTEREMQPFAWDIVGPRPVLAGISERFASTSRRASRPAR
jgi:hypothetical protein